MDEQAKKDLEKATADIKTLTDTVKKLSDTLAAVARNNSLQQAGPYAASTPTADGTIPFLIGGQRYNVLVDKI